MQFSEEVTTLSDGRKFIRCTEHRHKLKDVVLDEDFEADGNVTMQLTEGSAGVVGKYDTDILQAAKGNSEAWFGRKLSDKKIEGAYVPGVVQSGLMTCEKARVKGQVVVRAFNLDKTGVQLEDLHKGLKCHVLAELLGVIIYQKNFSPLWKVVQVLTLPAPKPKKPKRYTDECMFDEEDIPAQEAGQVDGDESDDGSCATVVQVTTTIDTAITTTTTTTTRPPTGRVNSPHINQPKPGTPTRHACRCANSSSRTEGAPGT